MKNGFVKVAAATPDIRVADVEFNTQNIINAMEEAQKNGAKILVFPELCVTGYTCSDLFDHSVLLKASRKALRLQKIQTTKICLYLSEHRLK